MHSYVILQILCFKVVNLAAILFMQIRWWKIEKSAWEQGLSDSAYLNYGK